VAVLVAVRDAEPSARGPRRVRPRLARDRCFRGSKCARIAGDPRATRPPPYAAPTGVTVPIDGPVALAEEAEPTPNNTNRH